MVAKAARERSTTFTGIDFALTTCWRKTTKQRSPSPLVGVTLLWGLSLQVAADAPPAEAEVDANETHPGEKTADVAEEKARFFTTPDGWQGNFTGSDIATRFPSFDAYLAERA